ncbi:hypothetical protein LXA43DRAFT_1046463 [Ganoderma leucocontextum]|nr:hypothetical protein LXA43DRAFT_1046463 [Ganoderma leucocontextum]
MHCPRRNDGSCTGFPASQGFTETSAACDIGRQRWTLALAMAPISKTASTPPLHPRDIPRPPHAPFQRPPSTSPRRAHCPLPATRRPLRIILALHKTPFTFHQPARPFRFGSIVASHRRVTQPHPRGEYLTCCPFSLPTFAPAEGAPVSPLLPRSVFSVRGWTDRRGALVSAAGSHVVEIEQRVLKVEMGDGVCAAQGQSRLPTLLAHGW